MHMRYLRKIVDLIRKKTWTTALVVFFFILFCGIFAFRQAGSWLVVDDALPGKLDALCTFAGENVRVKYSKKLAERYHGSQWFLSDHLRAYKKMLKKQNFDMVRLSTVDTCKSTISEINAMADWIAQLREAKDSSGDSAELDIGLVSSPYHMRRIKIMARRRIRIKRVRLYFLSVPFKYYSWDRESFRYWWRSNRLVSITTSELLKLGYFLLTGYF